VAPITVGEGSLCELTISAVAFVAEDDDGDGQADALTGMGSWHSSSTSAFTLTARPDDVAPSLKLYTALLSPLNFPSLHPTELLQAGASLALEGDSAIELEAETIEDGLVTGFQLRAILPFGGTWQGVASGRDLVGLPLTVTGELRTADDPGIFAQDGFEGSVPEAHGRITDARGVAIDGRSLVLVPGSVALHLARAEGQNTLRYSLRLVSADSVEPALLEDSPIYIGYGVLGGTAQQVQVGLDGELTATGDAEWGFATAVHSGTITLDEPGDDLVIAFSQGCVGPRFELQGCSYTTALILDDLKLE
jgi:hypothetical protein